MLIVGGMAGGASSCAARLRRLDKSVTGASEKGLRRAGVTSFETVYLRPGHHAGYYPGAWAIHLKLLFLVPDGRILGAQAVGLEGVEKRIDVIAT